MPATITIRDGMRMVDMSGLGLTAGGGPYVTGSDNEPERATFGAGIIGLSLGATPTDIVTIAGAAGKVIRVKSLIFNGNSATLAAYPIALIRRSTANTGGTSSVVVGRAHDTLDGASAATLTTYTANATALGTAVGTLHTGRVIAATASNLDRLILQYSWQNDKSIVLRGASDILAINMQGVTLSAATTMDVDLMWTEE